MKYLLFLTILTFSSSSYGQSGLQYAKSTVPYVKQPTAEIINSLNKSEERYYKNRSTCKNLENLLNKQLSELTIDSINKKYRDGLNLNLAKIQKMISDEYYGDYSLMLMDIIENLKSNSNYYEDEKEYIKKNLELEIQKNKQENERLKKELEFQKSLIKIE